MIVNGIVHTQLMAEKSEDWQRDETGDATSAEPFAACISISGIGSAESKWGPERSTPGCMKAGVAVSQSRKRKHQRGWKKVQTERTERTGREEGGPERVRKPQRGRSRKEARGAEWTGRLVPSDLSG